MTTRLRTVRRPGVNGARRKTAWSDTLIDTDISGLRATQELMGTGLADTQEKRGYTLIRTLINLVLFLTIPYGATGELRLHLGIVLVSNDARDAAAYPDPGDPVDSPVQGWVWRDHGFVADVAAGPSVAFVPDRIRGDIHSARKLDRASLVLVIDQVAVRGTQFDATIMGLIRNLYKMP